MKNIKDKSSLKILFININPRPGWTKEKTLIPFPMGLCYIISETVRSGYNNYELLDLKVSPKTDDEIKENILRNDYDVIALGTLSHSYNIVKPLLKLTKKILPNAIIVVGNSIASSQPEFFLRTTKADIAVIGEGEKTFIEILDRIVTGDDFSGVKGIAYKSGDRIIREPSRTVIMNLDDKKFPMWDIFEVEEYIQSAKKFRNERVYSFVTEMRPFPINTTRGCPFRCTFCSNSRFYKENPIRFYSPKYVIKLIKTLQKKYQVNYFWFWDELSFFSKKQAEPLIDALVEENLDMKFSANVRVGFLEKGDEEFAKKMRRAGCIQANYSLESGNSEILKAMDKQIDVKWFSTQKKFFDKANIISQTNIVIGYPQETEKTIKETFDICYENDLFPSVGFLLPAPGSIMYDYAIENGHIKDEEEYISSIGERQYLNINMTKIPDKRLLELTNYHLRRIRDKLGLDIDDDRLICSTVIEEEKNGANRMLCKI